MTARLVPFTVDGLIWAASVVVLDASRRGQPVPRLVAWSLGAGICATVGPNLAHGVGHGPVSAWAALALVGSFELLMMLIRNGRGRALLHAVGRRDADSTRVVNLHISTSGRGEICPMLECSTCSSIGDIVGRLPGPDRFAPTCSR